MQGSKLSISAVLRIQDDALQLLEPSFVVGQQLYQAKQVAIQLHLA